LSHKKDADHGVFFYVKVFIFTENNKKAPKNQCFYFIIILLKSQNFDELYSLLKRREFDAIKPHKYTVSCGDPVFFSAGIKIPTSLKRREFDG